MLSELIKLMDTQVLEELGLTPKEIDVYLVLLGLKSATASELINKAKIARQSAYEILQKLLDKGLVSFAIKDGKKQYIPANPERLLGFVKEKEARIEMLLPELLTKYNENKEETNAQVFLGKEGIKAILDSVLTRKSVHGRGYCVLANEGKIFDFLKYYMPQYMQNRAKAGIAAKVIYSESARKKKFTSPLGEVRYLSDEYSSPMSVIIYGDTVDYLIFSENPMGIHIESKEIAESFMHYFNLMWSMAKK
jgi:sugar-specific transcriptional regulator TrmB